MIKTFYVLVPKPGTAAAHLILPGSGIVAAAIGHDKTTVHFEGNRYRAASMNDYGQRVMQAAGRLDKNYPTVARGVWPTAEFVTVGQFEFYDDWRTPLATLDGKRVCYRLTISDPTTVATWNGEAA